MVRHCSTRGAGGVERGQALPAGLLQADGVPIVPTRYFGVGRSRHQFPPVVVGNRRSARVRPGRSGSPTRPPRPRTMRALQAQGRPVLVQPFRRRVAGRRRWRVPEREPSHAFARGPLLRRAARCSRRPAPSQPRRCQRGGSRRRVVGSGRDAVVSVVRFGLRREDLLCPRRRARHRRRRSPAAGPELIEPSLGFRRLGATGEGACRSRISR